MKKNVSKRILSAVLAFVMVFLMIPFGTMVVSAAEDYAVPTTSHKLLSSYNVLSGTDISSGDAQIISALDIFNRDRLNDLIKTNASYTNMHTQYGEAHEGKDMDSFAASIGVSLSRSVGVSIGVEKLFKASASKKFNFAADVEYSKEKEAYFYEYIVKVQKGYYSFNDAILDEIRDYSNGYLSTTFMKALTGEDGSTPEEFFNTYGTHIITAYTAGGEAGVSLNSVQTKTDVSVDIEAAYSNGGDGSATSSEGITLGLNKALEIKANIGVDTSSQNYSSSAYTYAYGGDDAIAFSSSGNNTTFNYESWLNSLNSDNSMILVDERLELIPIWNLMPVTGNENRILELTSYFMDASEQQDSEFFNYFAIDESLFDYSQDWLNFENCKIITNEEELNDIRNDLNGVYVLANNIVLSDYANWIPIGTKEEPFRGRLYGNYNTISGLDIYAYSSNDTTAKTYVGLFGCNDGLITDLKISGDITMSPITTDNVYIGAIAAYNEGIVNNCYDEVRYNISYDDYSKLNLPVREVAETSEATIVIGNEVGVCLSGTYENVTIQIAENTVETPAYIVLDGATITGSIYSGNDRPIYIISKGGANSIIAPNDTIAVNAPRASVNIFGDAELIVTGGSGSKGADGARGGSGEHRKPGESGKSGAVALNVLTLSVEENVTMKAVGGSGGNGGNGGAGNNTDFVFAAAKNGGDGGTGGNGAYAVSTGNIYTLSSNVEFRGGAGGNGGNGGARGEYGTNEGKKGCGGNGGAGGDALLCEGVLIQNDSEIQLFGGAGGNGGSGRSSGSPGADGSAIYHLANDHFYQLIKGSLSWESAKTACESFGGHLVTITSAEENAFVAALASGNAVWIGASDEETEGTFKWVTGETFSYSNWNSGEPNNGSGGTEDYAHIIAGADKWNDVYPSTTYYYICEWDSYEDYLKQIRKIESDETTLNVIAGVTCGMNKNGKIRTLNSDLWNNNILQIESVSKTEYFSGDSFDTMTVDITLYDKHISNYGQSFNSTCKGTALSRMGYIGVTYDDYVRYIPVHITKTIPNYVEISKVGKTEFAQGATFDISGLSIKVVYNNGNEKYIAESDVTYTTPSTEYAGQTEEVVVTYEESGLFFSTSYEITVVTDVVESIFIQNHPYKLTNYKQGEELSLDGLELYANKKSGKKEFIAIDNPGLDYTVSPSLCNIGTSTVTINYNGAITTYTITVSENKDFDHPWDKGIVTLDPTHTTTGVMTYHCTIDNCDATKTEPVPVLEGHAYDDWYKLNDTQHQRICECGDTVEADHMWDKENGVVLTPATHTAYGEMLYTCTKCDDTYTDVIEKLPEHTFGAWTEYDDTQHIRRCECGEVEYESHALINETVTVEPTYTTEGLKTYDCAFCDAVFEKVIPPLEIPEDAPYIVIDSKNAVIGETVTVKISLLNNPGIISMKLNVAYDTSLLTLSSVVYNNAMGGQSVLPEDIENVNGNLVLYWATGFSDYDSDDVFATLTFTVSPTADVGTTTDITVTYNANDIHNAEEDNVAFFCEDGELMLINYVPGDINGDSVVDTKDTTRLMRYLAGWNVEVNEAALDVNGDGYKDTKDTTRLMRYLAGWNVEIY